MPARKNQNDPTLGDGTVLDDITQDEIAELSAELPKLTHKIEQLEAEKREVSSDIRSKLRPLKERVSVVTQSLITKKIRRDAQAQLALEHHDDKGGKKKSKGNGAAAGA